jgi:hypothetical protein
MELILLQSMGGDKFSLTAGQLVEVDDETGQRFLLDGLGRGLLSEEPTELQLAMKYSFVSKGSETAKTEPSVAIESQLRPQRKRRSESPSQS